MSRGQENLEGLGHRDIDLILLFLGDKHNFFGGMEFVLDVRGPQFEAGADRGEKRSHHAEENQRRDEDHDGFCVFASHVGDCISG